MRTCNARVLTVSDIMLAHERACERLKSADNAAEAVVGIEILTNELLTILTEVRE